jgi:hypothetical protein
VTTSVAALLSLALVLGSLWMRRRAERPDPQATQYRRLGRMLALAALAVALFALWRALADHRRAPGANGARAASAARTAA